MGKCKDYPMSDRLNEELFRLGYTDRELSKKLGISHKTIAYWRSNNCIPGAVSLKLLHEVGADIMYIITGRRTNK